MGFRKLGLLVSGVMLAGTVSPALVGEVLRVQGSTTVNPVVTEALEFLREERGIRYRIDTLGGSAGGIRAVGTGAAEVGMSSKAIGDEDRRRHPGFDFHETVIAVDAVALVVGPDVWGAGVRSLSREQVQVIYERPGVSWTEFGGPDRRVVFFNKEPGRGTWSVFAEWSYGDPGEAPPVSHPEVGANEEVRTKVSRTRGALSQLSASWVDGRTVFALGIVNDSGETIRPEGEALANGHYPLSRPLLLVTEGEPEGAARELIEFLLGPEGQRLVRKHGYLSLAEAGL